MKKLMAIVATVLALGSASQTSAAAYTLVSCDYQWVPEYGKNVYVGTYESNYGNYFTRIFESYCPSIL